MITKQCEPITGGLAGRKAKISGSFTSDASAFTGLISIILTTYNREDALAAVLRSLSCQIDRRFEVIVADDGSGLGTREVVDSFASRLGVPLCHVWHEDEGFRVALIRNRAILKSTGSYCIFIDGDCVVRPHFVSMHRRLAERGWYVTGNRLLLSNSLTTAIFRDALQPENWGLLDWIKHRRQGGINRLAPLLCLPVRPLRKLLRDRWAGARACNLGVWREDLDRIDGFDAVYEGWGREDSDLFVRLHRAGVRRKLGNFATGVIHLWHPDADRSKLETNERLLDEVIVGGHARARRGLSALAATR